MEWSAISFDWNQARAFLATAQEGSLTRAAKALHLTQPTLSRQVQALEESLGVTLFERSGRALSLTQSGHDLLEHVRAMGVAASQMSLSASGHAQDVTGEVRISAGDTVAAYALPRIMPLIQKEAPGVTLEVISSDALSNLSLREADIAIRHVEPSQSELIARRLPDATAHLYASRSYLAQAGDLATLYERQDFDYVGFDRPERVATMLEQYGVRVPVHRIKSYSENGVVGWEMARTGMGVCVMSDSIARHFPDMVPLPGDYTRIGVPIWLTTHRELRTSRRIRVVYDALAEGLLSTFCR